MDRSPKTGDAGSHLTLEVAPASLGSPTEVTDDAARLGTRAGEYRLLRVIGRGGGGTVYEAAHVGTHRPAALKVLRDAGEGTVALARFEREIEISRTLEHPSIVRVFDEGRLDDGSKYCVMELLRGEDLEQLLARSVRLSPEECRDILLPVFDALAVAHAAGVIHRDLKAGNVFIEDGNPPRIRLLDFGIARVEPPEQVGLTARGVHVGTPQSMAPEQILCQPADPRTDVYAAGVLLFRMLTGDDPFAAEEREELMLQHLTAPAPAPSQRAPVSPALDTIVRRCLEKRPQDRYPSILDLREALLSAVGTSAAPSRPRASRCWAIYTEGSIPESDTLEEAARETLLEIVDACADRLAELGFDHGLSTSRGVLMLAPVGDAPEKSQKMLELVQRLVRESNAAIPRGCELSFSIHVGDAILEDGDAVGGDVLDLRAWTGTPEEASGVRLTRAARQALGE